MAPNLSKSRFVAGWQCHKQLWLKVHEPEAPELQVDIVLQDRFDQGAEVVLWLGIKQVLKPMVPDLTYDDLAIVDGMVASAEIARPMRSTPGLNFSSPYGLAGADDTLKVQSCLLWVCPENCFASKGDVGRLHTTYGPK